ncbi:hypothetical protein DPMN_140152 [Dreissena polymorpha]|uniref:Uncharacterized protein n=1 Tax=Dreissena polymorpha TaxID=45954 RepID=A0A9D4G7N1_DREPO|nr:hypothetical protein DPMN_140152 [Dreissena polymorpha]
MHRINIEKNGKRVKTDEQVLTYKEIFYTNDTLNQSIFIQGEAGREKTTFAVMLVHDWCNEIQPLSTPSENPTFEYRLSLPNKNQLSSAAPTHVEAFSDRSTVKKFKFLFFITLRDSMNHTDVTQIIKKQYIDNMFSKDERVYVNKLFLQIIQTESCLVVREGLDEWVSPSGSNLA